MNRKFGIDISKWQGNFDLALAREDSGVEFVIVKAGGGDKGLYTDKQWENNYKKAKAIGMPIGAYWYSKATTIDKAQQEAQYFLNLLKGKQLELPVYMDVEERCMLDMPSKSLCDVVDAFCHMVESMGYYTGIYSSTAYFNAKLNQPNVKKYTWWIARWGTVKPENVSLWQFGGETNKIRTNKVNGITVDQDYLYTDFEAVIKNKHLNGF